MEICGSSWVEATGNTLEELPAEIQHIILIRNEPQFLNTLAVTALQPKYTSKLFTKFAPVFADTCARWSENTCNKNCIIAAFARILPLAPQLVVFLEKYIDLKDKRENFIEILCVKDDAENIPRLLELQQTLLAMWRLLNFDRRTFSRLIEGTKVQSLFQHSNLAVRYLAVRVFCQLMLVADSKLEEMIVKIVGREIIQGDFDGHSKDLIFLSLLEESRLREVAKQAKYSSSTVFGLNDCNMTHLTSQVSRHGEILLPRPNGLPKFSSKIVQTATTSLNMERLAASLLTNSPILLYGLPGSGKTLLVNDFAREFGEESNMIKLHLNEQTDVKMLIGLYTTGSTPGTFSWKQGVLTTAVKEGRWIFIEDFDTAPNDVISVILSLIERRELLIPNRGEVIKAGRGFRILASIQTILNLTGQETLPPLHTIGAHIWQRVHVQMPSHAEICQIINTKYPTLHYFLPIVIDIYKQLQNLPQKSPDFTKSRNNYGRTISSRDLMKWCRRLEGVLIKSGSIASHDSTDEGTRYEMFLEAADCFAASFRDTYIRKNVILIIAEAMQIEPQRAEHFITSHFPRYEELSKGLIVGRANLTKQVRIKKSRNYSRPFANTTSAMRLLEQIGVAIKFSEPVLLVGETGIGKTTAVQQISDSLGYKLTVVNLSQQCEVSDLLGSYKPVNVRFLAVPLKDEFDELFTLTGLSASKNQKYFELLNKYFAKNQWTRVLKLWREAPKMYEQILSTISETKESFLDSASQKPAKRRKTESRTKLLLNLKPRWEKFAENLDQFDMQLRRGSKGFAFSFVESNIIKAARNGDWVLLDEINLASPDTLESIADLLHNSSEESPSILLSETGDIKRIYAHPDFRIFGAMNPATDVGKRDLPPSLRSRFTEIYVDDPDRNLSDLINIAQVYLKGFINNDENAIHDVAKLYIQTKKLAEEKRLVDGANQVPHFSLRTFTRVLSYVKEMAPLYGLRRALAEGFSMGFLTLLDRESEKILAPLIDHQLMANQKNSKAILSQTPKYPVDGKHYVPFMSACRNRHYWLLKGHKLCEEQQHYIRTPSVDRNILNLVRAISTRLYPVLIQGPTSSGKTSMVEYLAKVSGNKFVRINNHEHTDLQEYLGSYMSDSDGRLRFQEGVLIQALRQGHWIILDELNLAPTDVLEALNRLLDDNREILIPETQEIVRPHDNFMLFATQNPPGHYGGRKTLSRAFRNRFLELHFDDIPEEELETILSTRCQNVAPSDCRRIVKVYKELVRLRQANRLFEHKNSFATLRDLFRWAFRSYDTREQLAANGYMLLAERVRNIEERNSVKLVIENVMKVKLNPAEQLYNASLSSEIKLYNTESNSQEIVWTKAMKRLYILVAHAIRNNEPVLLVGETGCGKTTVCQMLAEAFSKRLFTVNAHQNLETGDLIGAQRPIRNRTVLMENLKQAVSKALSYSSNVNKDQDLDDLLEAYQMLPEEIIDRIPPEDRQFIHSTKIKLSSLFEWHDGGLVQAMKEGQFFLLDEISLADDAVLERLNSVLETERTILLAEKGTENSFVKAANGFQIFGTMNPGGDYGKRELSPALRNRFTEIWVPALSDQDDILQIVESKLNQKFRIFTKAMVQFAEWFAQTHRHISTGSTSIRSMLTWIKFMNECSYEDIYFCIVQGVAMVYIDTIGANPAALLAVNNESIAEERKKCLCYLGTLLKYDILPYYTNPIHIINQECRLEIGGFSLLKRSNPKMCQGYAFDAPTTKVNAMRVIRAFQVRKPILIEGNPGVGKTTLINALALACNQPLTRINLSEQTDLMDLFGSDVPVDGAEIGQFAWRDAPFLQAMQKGEWVLLDEMNLASQSVLEGLNACLDHRGQVYISELDKTFLCHPDFFVFAAQNPHHQGGGRKGLPSSFVNRFTVVYADVLSYNDLKVICKKSFPDISEETISCMISFVSKLEKEIIEKRSFGAQGGPWELNLRDILRWLQILTSRISFLQATHPSDLIQNIFRQRFRTAKDCLEIDKIHVEIFPSTDTSRHLFHNITPNGYQIGLAYLPRNPLIQKATFPTVDLTRRLSELESIMICVQQNIPCLLVGASGSGKTTLLQYLSAITGNKLVTFSLNSDTDTMDLIGGFEQADPQRTANIFLEDLTEYISQKILSYLPYRLPFEAIELVELLKNEEPPSHRLFLTLAQKLSLMASQTNNLDFEDFAKLCQSHSEKLKVLESIQFEWVNGVLVKTLQQGDWLILDNANLCSSSVLDRLNSLLEPNGFLCINEHCGPDGKPRVIKPHPNFRIFMTMDPKFGELSRSMRNRTLEIYLEPHQSLLFKQTPLPIRSEASMQRFRYVLKTLEQTGTKEISSAIDNLSRSDLLLLPRFHSLFDHVKATELWPVIQPYTSICEDFVNERMRNILIETYNSLNDKSLLEAQVMHPLQNSPLVSTIVRSQKSEQVIWLGAIFDFFLDITVVFSGYDRQKAALEHLKPKNMNRFQRSLIKKRAPAVAKDSTVNVAEFLDITLRFLRKFLRSNLLMKENWRKIKSTVSSLLRFCQETFRLVTNSTFEEETFQAHLTIGRDTFITMKTENLSIAQTLIEILEEKFSCGFKLTTGLSMEPMWKNLRPLPISNIDVFTTLLALEDLAVRFDSLKWKALNTVSELGNITNSLIKAYRLILASRVDGTALVTSLTQEIAFLEKGIGIEKEDTTPYFKKQFEAIRQYQIINEIWSDSDEIFVDVNTLVLSDYPTLMSLNFGTSTFSSKSLQIVDFFCGSDCELSLVTNSILPQTLERLNDIESIQLSSLRLLEAELPILSQKFAILSSEFHRKPSLKLKNILLTLIEKVVESHGSDIVEFWNTLCANINEKSSPKFLSDTIVSPYLREILENNFLSSLHHCKATESLGNPTLKSLALAWIEFAIGSIKLYVPDKAYDPDKRQRLELEQHANTKATLMQKLNSLRNFEKLFSGQDFNLRCQILENDLKELGKPPEILQNIYRPEISEILQLQGEFNNLLNIVLETKLVAAINKDGVNLQTIKLLQSNTNQIISRLSHRYKAYKDLTRPIICILRCLQIGLSLAIAEESTSESSNEIISELEKLTPFMAASDLVAEKFANSYPFEYITMFATKVKCERISNMQPDARHSILKTVNELYNAWKSRLETDRSLAESRGGLYRYRGGMEDENEIREEQFEELFPSYDEESTQKLKSKQSSEIRDNAVKLAKAHAEIFFGTAKPVESIKGLMKDMSTGISSHFLANSNYDCFNMTSAFLPGILLLLDSKIKEYGSNVNTESYNFYTSPNLPECRKLVILVHRIQSRFLELQQSDDIKHLQPLENVLLSCSELLRFYHTDPLAKIITKVENVHAFMHEWQFGGWASKSNTALNLYEDVTSTIISWRRLELSTWAGIFDMEMARCEDDAKSWWFIAYEIIIVAPLLISGSDSEVKAYARKLSTELETYFYSAILGQYSQRLLLLKQLQKHIEILKLEVPSMSIILRALTNFIFFYSRFEKIIVNKLKKDRSSLDKSMRDVLLMASWKDTNIIALQESAKRSHHKLFKIVRKFRNILSQPVEAFLIQGLPDEEIGKDLSLEKLSFSNVTIDSSALNFCISTVPRWSLKSKRLVNVSNTVRLMVDTARIPTEAINESSILESFLGGIIDSMTELQKSTPSTLSKENQNYVNHLKSRKKKLFADTLKDLRMMGIKYNLGSDILLEQGSLSILLTEMGCWKDFVCQTAEYYFHKSIDSILLARSSIKQHSPDLSSAEVTRSMGFLEGLLQITTSQHNFLSSAGSALKKLDLNLRMMKSLRAPDYGIRTDSIISNHYKVLQWLPNILQVGLEVIEIHSKFGKIDSGTIKPNLESWISRFTNLKQRWDDLPCLPSKIVTTERLSLQHMIYDTAQQLAIELADLRETRPDLIFIINPMIPWTRITSCDENVKSTSSSIIELDSSLSRLADSVLVAVENYKKEISYLPTSTDDLGWFIKSSSTTQLSLKALHLETITDQIEDCFILLARLDLNDAQTSEKAGACFAMVLPLLQQYLLIFLEGFKRYVHTHRTTCKTSYILAKSFCQIATKGFCTPSEKSDIEDGNSESLEGGTGLGDGKGAEDISKDVHDEDLEELAQEPCTQEKDEIMDEPDAVDMADCDMEGQIDENHEVEEDNNLSEDDKNEDQIDEEEGSVDDLDPSAIDEKMWDGDDQEADKDQQGSESKGNSSKDELAAAQENQKSRSEQDDKNDETIDDQVGDETVGDEQKDEVMAQNELERQDPYTNEVEALNLPDDMALDEEDQNGISEDEDGLDSLSDVDKSELQDMVSNTDENENGDKEGEKIDDQGDIEENFPEAEIDDSKGKDGEDGEEKTDEVGEKQIEDENMSNQEIEEELLRDNDDQNQGHNEEIIPSDNNKGVGESNDDFNDDGNPDIRSKSNQDDGGQKGNSSKDEAEDSNQDQSANFNPSKSINDENQTTPNIAESFKKLGDVLEEWHRQQTKNNDLSDEKTEEKKILDNTIYDTQHLQDENATPDTQALGTATEEQAHALDEAMGIDEELKDFPDQYLPIDDEKYDDDPSNDMEIDEFQTLRDEELNESNHGQVGAVIKHTKNIEIQNNSQEYTEEIDAEVDQRFEQIHLDNDDSTKSSQISHQQWTHYEVITRDLSLSLTEQLRLILAPTMATKMRGDFRTGKRLNIKRIIPYIASQYKRDKIWMRRSLPSKRNYQVMLAVDDSKSMGESGSGLLAFETLVMVSKSLSMLEVGEICVIGFGEDVKIAHDFDTTFSSNSGLKILQNFGFQQNRTDIPLLVKRSMEIFRSARAKANRSTADLWQLELIISDGICESHDHDKIKRLIREATEERIMMVFVIVDDVKSKKGGQSVMNLSQAMFIDGTVTTSRYLDSFPFQYYIVVNNVRDLPGVLATLLRQWFQEIAESSC
ncbi:Huge dynein-related AAA-type ATPase [Golovinomyces cichoracearum]|uniref:Midasin n=1 Tax=Golovinomyces cichoracearum TaxID=62708 RepID=A0A420IB72_9PEZI|nr:Huge dynein-related AAA-type ATPase [Golovinomyces cichoracearum]